MALTYFAFITAGTQKICVTASRRFDESRCSRPRVLDSLIGIVDLAMQVSKLWNSVGSVLNICL